MMQVPAFAFSVEFFRRLCFWKTEPSADGFRYHIYLYKRIYHYLKPYAFRFWTSILITLPIGALDAAIAYSIRPYTDLILLKQSIASISMVPLIIIGFTLVQGLMNYISIYLNGWIGERVQGDLRLDLYERMQAQDVWHFDLNTSGSVIQRYFYDPHIVQLYLLTNVKQILTRFVSSLSLITVLWVTSWKLALVATVMLCVTLLPSTKIRNVIRKATTHANDLTGDLLSMYTETIGGIRLIQSYNLAESRKSLFVRQQRYLFSQVMRLIKAQGWLTPSMHIISSLAVAVIIWMGSYLVISKELSTGAFVSFLAALILLYNPIKNLGSSILSTQIALLAASRVFDILDSPPTRLELMEGIQLLAPVGDIRFENVCFSYLNDHPVLEDINLHIRENETVAFVGESGGGKTTLVNLLLRFYDVWDGAISIGGRDIRSINMASLRQHISLVTQDSFLFNTTIRKNILVGKANADETELWQVLEKVGLDKFIKKLPNGLETIVGDRGTALSGGQRQRITIARALLKDAPIVVLDEATSALDNESEHFIQQAIQDLMKSKTVIIIAHRLSTIQQADRVVVIGGGRILEQGSPQNLCNSKGVYHRLYQLHLAAAL